MTRLLVSVRDESEAALALDAGVDLLDVKEPSRGGLGAAAPETIASIVALVDGRLPTSAALGELRDFVPADFRAVAGLSFAKLGLAGCAGDSDWRNRWQNALALLPSGAKPAAVAYADWRTADSPSPYVVAATGAELGCGALLLDTFDKHGGDLFAHFREDSLRHFIGVVRSLGLPVVLAGSLRGESILRAIDLQPDYIAVRGAVCRGDRRSPIDEALLAQTVERVKGNRSAAADPSNATASPN